MTLQELDAVLAGWNNRLAAVADNLLELQAEPAYQALAGTGQGGSGVQIIGTTAARVKPALRAIPTIYLHFGLLRTALDRAEAIRRTLPAMFGADAKLAELQSILFARSITLPATDVPLSQRSLVSGASHADTVTAEELLQRMVTSFAQAKDAVLAVSRAWSELAAELDRTEARMRRLGADRDADRMLAETRGRIQADPLGALEYLNAEVAPLLAAAEARVAASAQLDGAFRRAHAQWTALEQRHAESLAAAREHAERFAELDGVPRPVPEDKLHALHLWLDRLEQRRVEAATDALHVGLRNWCATAEAYARQEEAVCAAYAGARETRRELRGRLDALKAKARVYGLAETVALLSAAQRAESLLTERPTSLPRAAAAVAGYEQQLSGIAMREGVRR